MTIYIGHWTINYYYYYYYLSTVLWAVGIPLVLIQSMHLIVCEILMEEKTCKTIDHASVWTVAQY